MLLYVAYFYGISISSQIINNVNSVINSVINNANNVNSHVATVNVEPILSCIMMSLLHKSIISVLGSDHIHGSLQMLQSHLAEGERRNH